MSFGYKHGLPLDVDLVLDCRFLPNPHWVEELRPQTGLHDAGAATTCSTSRRRRTFLERLDGLLGLLLPGLRGGGQVATCRSRSGAPAAATGRWPSPRPWPSLLRARGLRADRHPPGRRQVTRRPSTGRRHRRRARARRHAAGGAAVGRPGDRRRVDGRRRRVHRAPAGVVGRARPGRRPALPGRPGRIPTACGPGVLERRFDAGELTGHAVGQPAPPGAHRGAGRPAVRVRRGGPDRRHRPRPGPRRARSPTTPSCSTPAPRTAPWSRARWRWPAPSGSTRCGSIPACTAASPVAVAAIGEADLVRPRPGLALHERAGRRGGGRCCARRSSTRSARVAYVGNLRADGAETRGYDLAAHVGGPPSGTASTPTSRAQPGAWPRATRASARRGRRGPARRPGSTIRPDRGSACRA